MSHLRPASLTGPSRELVVDPDVADVSDARQFVREHCHALGFDADACDTAVLLTSETVTNAVTHGRSEARIRVTATPGLMLVEVADGNSRHPQRQPQDPDALDGRRMSIIDLLAARWGVRDDPYGKTVWFEVRSPSDLDGTAPDEPTDRPVRLDPARQRYWPDRKPRRRWGIAAGGKGMLGAWLSAFVGAGRARRGSACCWA